MRVGILGSTGFIGNHLTVALRARGDEVVALPSREPEAAASQASSCDVIVNVAGEPVAQRWSDDVKRKIRESRADAPRRFIEALRSLSGRPTSYISASAIGYYGTKQTHTLAESSPPGDDFLAEVCVAWEATAHTAAELGMRVVILRTGVVLGKDGGAMEKLLPAFRAGVGGRVGSGKQWFSWIHIDDVVGLYMLAIDGSLDGAINATAPNPVTNAEFTKVLGSAVHRPTFFPVPMVALKAMLGEGADTVTQGQKVMPERALAAGYTFAYPELEQALREIAS
ncbi:MAG: TIGR01777 family oxidoreductase [Candidatus Eremiobacteraeota bacterium]|nr:TIGR01777 family oxidoreductase [Candidatus Eremiobacteraeota bacterium]